MWFAVVWVAPGIDSVFVAVCNRPGQKGFAACDEAIAAMIGMK